LLVVGALGLLLLLLLGAAGFWGWRWYRSMDLEGRAESLFAELTESGQDEAAEEQPAEPFSTAGEDLSAVEPSLEPVTPDTEVAAEPPTAARPEPGATQGAAAERTPPRALDAGAATPDRPTTSLGTTPAQAQALAAPPAATASPGSTAATTMVRPGVRHGGTLRFGQAIADEIEPEETVEYDIEVRRPTYIYFDIVFATRPATYTLHDADGAEVFRQLGNDLGPFRLERAGWYRLSVQTDAEIPVEYEIEFRQVGG
jgi:hypothetical protein